MGENPIRQVKRILSYRMKMFDGENLFPQNDTDGQIILKRYIFRRSNFINLLFIAVLRIERLISKV